MTEDFRCFMCSRQTAIGEPAKDEAWDLGSLKMILKEFKLCPRHVTYCEARIPELEKTAPKVVILKTGEPKQFIPKQTANNPENYQDREPGEEG
jgi:hypothetical protein